MKVLHYEPYRKSFLVVCPTYRIQKYNDDSVITIIFCVDYYLLLKKISKKLENKENHAVSNTQEKLVTQKGIGIRRCLLLQKLQKLEDLLFIF